MQLDFFTVKILSHISFKIFQIKSSNARQLRLGEGGAMQIPIGYWTALPSSSFYFQIEVQNINIHKLYVLQTLVIPLNDDFYHFNVTSGVKQQVFRFQISVDDSLTV